MSEIIVIDDDDDLEEGEIADNSEPEVDNSPKSKHKKLPRRYNLNKSKDFKSKPKKYKHPPKIKHNYSDSFSKSNKRKHRSFCPRHTVEKSKSSNVSSSDKNRQNISFKGAFKNYASPPRIVINSEKSCQNKSKDSDSDGGYSKLLSDYKKTKERLNNIVATANKNENTTKSKIDKLIPKVDEELKNSVEKQQLPKNRVLEEITIDEDSEDEEELRRIALSTRAKKLTANLNLSECSNDTTQKNLKTNTEESFKDIYTNGYDGIFDNHEVVDMDLDNESSAENSANDIFVIDKNPSVNLHPIINLVVEDSHSLSKGSQIMDTKIEHCFPSTPSESNDDFEEELLRAELIASMNSRKKSPTATDIERFTPPPANDIETSEEKNEPAKPVVFDVRDVTKEFFTNNPSKPRINNSKSFKSSKTNYTDNTLPVINPSSDRLIIRITNDSTTDESGTDEEKPPAKENVPISSIEALISNARQQSNIKNGDNRVSCLSKTQQEEYNSLKRILAEKDSFSLPVTSIVKAKTVTEPSNLNFLNNKILTAKDNLKSQVLLMNKIEKDILRKKQIYMTSKLKVQHLKEQLHAAEIVRARHLEGWKKCTAKLDILKKAVTKRRVLIGMLETKFNSKPSIEQKPS